MKIRVSEIPPEGIEIDEEEDLGAGAQDVVRRARLSLRVDKVKDEVFITGQVGASLSLQCGRCLKDFADDMTVDIDLAFSPVQRLKEAEKGKLSADELEVGFYEDDEIDLGQISLEQILLNVPMKPLCEEMCKGLCPSCGADLNVSACDCKVPKTNQRFQALEKLLKKGKE